MALVAVMFGLFNLSGAEIILILALLLILFTSKNLPGFTKRIGSAFDKESADAGRSISGIYGKPAGQGLTVDNEVADLYDPAVFQNGHERRRRRNRWLKAFSKIWQRLLRFLRFSF